MGGSRINLSLSQLPENGDYRPFSNIKYPNIDTLIERQNKPLFLLKDIIEIVNNC